MVKEVFQYCIRQEIGDHDEENYHINLLSRMKHIIKVRIFLEDGKEPYETEVNVIITQPSDQGLPIWARLKTFPPHRSGPPSRTEGPGVVDLGLIEPPGICTIESKAGARIFIYITTNSGTRQPSDIGPREPPDTLWIETRIFQVGRLDETVPICGSLEIRDKNSQKSEA